MTIAQEALRLTQQKENDLTSEEIEKQQSIAATEAIEDYTFNKELTAFTSLDSEPFNITIIQISKILSCYNTIQTFRNPKFN